MDKRLQQRKRRTALVGAGIVAAMVALSFASVPLYDLFCRVTGYGGTTQQAESASEVTLDREITVRFDASVNGELPWTFQPVQREIKLKVGENGLAFYGARNRAKRPVTGTATFNVTPLKAGAYFVKVDCFCFTEQRLEPGQSVDMPVAFYIDPAIADDPGLDEVTTITLSYTFFRAEVDELAAADGTPETGPGDILGE